MYSDVEAERQVVGAILRSELMGMLLADVRLEAEHFADRELASAFGAAARLYERGEGITPLTVGAESRLNGYGPISRTQLAALARDCANPADAPDNARLIQRTAEWRHRAKATKQIIEAVKSQDAEALAAGQEQLAVDVVRAGDSHSPESLAHALREHINSERPDVFPWPVARLNEVTGGLLRGELTLLGAWSSHGKTVLLDQTLEAVGKRYRAHLYINEMIELQRVARIASRRTGVPFHKIMQAALSGAEKGAVERAVASLPFGITACPGWSAQEIAFHIRRNRWDFAAVDILHEIPYENEGDLRQIGSTLNRCTKQADCHIVATVHLSEHRAHGQSVLPTPVLSDIRGSGMLKNQADFVVFVHRNQEIVGKTVMYSKSGDGTAYVAKGRNTGLGGVKLHFNGKRFRWEAPSAQREADAGEQHVLDYTEREGEVLGVSATDD